MIVPLIVSKYTSGTKPMSAYMKLMPIRYENKNKN